MLSKKAVGALMLRICTERGLKVDKAALLYLADGVTEALNGADMVRKKLGSVELSRKTLLKQLEQHDAEEAKLREECPHLHVTGETVYKCSIYKCSICTAEVVV